LDGAGPGWQAGWCGQIGMVGDWLVFRWVGELAGQAATFSKMPEELSCNICGVDFEYFQFCPLPGCLCGEIWGATCSKG
jgi:hypothetical protein